MDPLTSFTSRISILGSLNVLFGTFMTPTSLKYHTRFADNSEPVYPTVPFAIFTIFTLIFTLTFGLLQYSSKVILTLAAVEAPSSVYLPPETDPDVRFATTTSREYITSSIRGTVRHLREQGGKFAPWRGIVPAAILRIIETMVTVFFVSILNFLPGALARTGAACMAAVIAVRLAVGYTHIVISIPSSQRWYRRILNTPWSAARKTLPAALHLSLFTSIARELTLQTYHSSLSTTGKVVAEIAILSFSVILIVPASMILVRMQASLLPEDTEAIVPFDRSFGIMSEIRAKAAWKSFRGSEKRLVKLVAKIVGGLMGIGMVVAGGAGFVWAWVLASAGTGEEIWGAFEQRRQL